MKNDSKTTGMEHPEIRAGWAREQAELFLNTLEQVGVRMGIRITPLQYVQAYKVCIEDLKFGYPAEYKIAGIISSEETYEQTLALMSAIMKKFRLAYWQTTKKQASKNRKASQKKRKAA